MGKECVDATRANIAWDIREGASCLSGHRPPPTPNQQKGGKEMVDENSRIDKVAQGYYAKLPSGTFLILQPFDDNCDVAVTIAPRWREPGEWEGWDHDEDRIILYRDPKFASHQEEITYHQLTDIRVCLAEEKEVAQILLRAAQQHLERAVELRAALDAGEHLLHQVDHRREEELEEAEGLAQEVSRASK